MSWVKKGASGPLGSKMSYGNRRTRLFETLLLMYRFVTLVVLVSQSGRYAPLVPGQGTLHRTVMLIAH